MLKFKKLSPIFIFIHTIKILIILIDNTSHDKQEEERYKPIGYICKTPN